MADLLLLQLARSAPVYVASPGSDELTNSPLACKLVCTLSQVVFAAVVDSSCICLSVGVVVCLWCH